jgi:DNA-binding NarL/FixJ family response regulator
MISILIAEDHAIVRAGIRALLEMHHEFEVVGEAASGEEALLLARELEPDVILMDIGMPGIDGLTATSEIKAALPQARILVLTQHENREYVIPALKAGAVGYVLKRAPDDTLIQAIQAVSRGENFIDPRLSEVILDDMRRQSRGEPSDPFDTLTEREREVLTLLAQGKTYQQVADTLFISVKTVDFHRSNLMRKLSLSNRAELTRFAMQRGLIT